MSLTSFVSLSPSNIHMFLQVNITTTTTHLNPSADLQIKNNSQIDKKN